MMRCIRVAPIVSTNFSMIVSLFGLAACASSPVEEHHYSLLLDALNDSTFVQPQDTDATLTITSITLPEYLRSNNLVMQVGDNEILPARRHFWAEPLAESIKSVLTYDLDRRLPDIAVRSMRADDGCLLEVVFERFHATSEARVVASGRYSLQSPGGQVERRFDMSRTLPVGGYANSISELRNSVSELATELSSAIEGAVSCMPAVAADRSDRREEATSQSAQR